MEEEAMKKTIVINDDGQAENQTVMKSHLSGKLSKISALRRTAAEELKKENDPEKKKIKVKGSVI